MSATPAAEELAPIDPPEADEALKVMVAKLDAWLKTLQTRRLAP